MKTSESVKMFFRDGETAIGQSKVTNTGKTDGEEVVQLYVKHLNSSVERPIKELKGFRRVAIQAGKTVTVDLPLKAERSGILERGKSAVRTGK